MSFLESFWQQRLELLLSAGRGAGADLVEVILERGDRLGVMAEQERVTSVSPAFVTGAGVRVFRGKDHGYRDGFVSTNDLSEAGLLQALDQALGMLGLERNSAAASADFQGLPALKDYGLSKERLVGSISRCAVIAERLLEGTAGSSNTPSTAGSPR